MFSLFVLMTFEDWYNSFIIPVLQPSPILAFLFVLYLLLTSFSVLNILCGLFVSSTMLAADDQALESIDQKERKRQERMQRLHDVFDMGDANHDGVITFDEFQVFVKDAKVGNALKMMGVKA